MIKTPDEKEASVLCRLILSFSFCISEWNRGCPILSEHEHIFTARALAARITLVARSPQSRLSAFLFIWQNCCIPADRQSITKL